MSGLTISGGALTVDVSGGSFVVPITFSGASLTISGASSGSDWTVNGDGTGSVTGGGVGSVSFSGTTSLSASGDATLHGPGADTTWSVTGADSGTVAGTTFSGFAHLDGAANNKDTFNLAAGASVQSVDGGDGGYDTLAAAGNTVVSNPTDAHSGTLVVDGNTVAYAGLEPVSLSFPNVIYNGADSGAGHDLPDAVSDDLITVGPGDAAGQIKIRDCLITGCSDIVPDLAEATNIDISSLSGGSLTINGGIGTDTVEFTGNVSISGVGLTVNAEKIKVDPGVTVDTGTAAIAFNAKVTDDGFDTHGVDTTLLGDNASINIGDSSNPSQGATLNAGTVDLEATSENAQTTVKGASQDLSGGTLTVVTTGPFLSSGEFTIAGIPSCTFGFTGTTNHTQFTGVSVVSGAGCTATPPADGAQVTSVGIIENESSTLIGHSALQLLYGASVDVEGPSSITSTGNVTLNSTVNVIGTANGQPLKWVSGTAYASGSMVIDPTNQKLYDAKNAISGAALTEAPSTNSTDWEDAGGGNAISISSLVASATSQLSGTSTINAGTGGNVKISSSLTTNITTTADATLTGSGAGIAVGVVVTTSKAFVDSTAGTPVTAKTLTVSADTSNTAPATGTASASASSSNSSSNNPNSPSSLDGDSNTSSQATKADNQSKTSDGSQGTAAAFGVTVLVATTQAYIASSNGSAITISTAGGTQTIHAGAANNVSATANAGNVKFSPDAPASTVFSTGGTIDSSQTYYYDVTALSVNTTSTVNGPGQNVAGGILHVGDTSQFNTGGGKFTGTGITGVCKYLAAAGGTISGITGCIGTPADGATITDLNESMAGPETKVDFSTSTGSANRVRLTWNAVSNAVDYEVYRSDATGTEMFLAALASTPTSETFFDNGGPNPTADTPPSADPKSGVGIAVAVDVAVVDTRAYVGNNANLMATTVTVETTAPSASGFGATAISGAGGSSVGVAGSIAVNIVVDTTTSDIEGTTAAATLNGAGLVLNATSNLANTALATAQQGADGSTSGVGASFALNVVNDTTIAGLPLNAQITGGKDLTINATDTDASTTTANGGASAGSSGSLALSAQVAITLANVTTSADVGPGADLTLTGALTAKANQTASSKTIAVGATKGGSATVGLSLGLGLINDLVDSQLERNLTAGGAVSFTANGVSANDTEATASSAGAKGKASTTPGDGDGSSKSTVNQKADANAADANSASSGAGGKSSGTTTTPSANTGGTAQGGSSSGTTVTVAAAVAIAIITAHAISGMPDGTVVPLTLTTTGSSAFNTTEDADSTAKSNGSAVNGSSANIGAAVSINLFKVENFATIGANDIDNSAGLTLSAVMAAATGSAPDGKNTIDTEATSGAGGGKFGLAGSLALTIADVETNAEINANSGRGPPGFAGDNSTGAVSLTATSVVVDTNKAMANDKDAGTVGIGAGAAIDIVNDTTNASIDSNAVISGATTISLSATATDTETTFAEAGAAGKAGSDVAFTADAAISLPTVLTTATIAGDTSQTLTSGAITLTAKQTASTTTTAQANATTGDVVIGLALALAVPDDEVYATDSRTISGAAVSFTATSSSATTTEADASATGATGDAGSGDGSGKDVNGKGTQQIQSANSDATTNGAKSSNTTDTSNAQATTADKNSSGGNTVTVAGAAAINIVTSHTEASLADTANVTATGLLTIKTSANTDASAVGSGKETEAGTVGIGAGVAVNSVTTVNHATTNDATVSSAGIDIEAGMTVNGKDQIQVFDGTDWKTIDSGATFPGSPDDGDYFQLTKAGAATTTVSGDQTISSGGSLTVASTDGFGALGGTFTVNSITGTCNYTSASGGTISGITGCTGSAKDKSTVTLTTSTTAIATPATTTVAGASQNLAAGAAGTLNVASTVGFPTTGAFTVAGIAGTCQYTGTTLTSFTGITNCGGTPADGALVTYVDSVNTTPTSTTVNETTIQALSSGLIVKSVAAFPTTGTHQFTVSGLTGTCSYTSLDATTNTLNGITGCTGTLVNGAAVTLVITPENTLTVASTTGFDPSGGKFTAAGLNGTCAYTSASSTTFFGISGCTGIVANSAQIQRIHQTTGVYQWDDGTSQWVLQFASGPLLPSGPTLNQYFLLTAAVTQPNSLAAGLYKWNGTSWVSEGGTDFPTSPVPAKGNFFQLAEDYNLADGISGAGGDKDSVSVAGALGLNIVSQDTEATVGKQSSPGGSVNANSGPDTLKAQANEEEDAKADSDAKSGKVGIGASVALDIATSGNVRAAIENGATFNGGSTLTISASYHHDVGTEDKAGSAAKTVSLSPSVSLAIVDDTTTAYIGTGNALTVSGAAAVSATEDFNADLKSDASAGGPDVAIGAAVAINIIDTVALAEVNRDLTAASLAVTATTTQTSGGEADASASGEQDGDDSADQQNQAQTSNPASSGKTGGSLPSASDNASTGSSDASSQSGDSDSGGVGIAAAVALNWAQDSNTASIAVGIHVTTTGTGAVTVSAQNQTNANAKAIGLAGGLSSSTAIGAGVGLNVESVTNTASVGADAHVTAGGDVSVEAETPGTKEDDFVAWGIAAAGGTSDASVAASVAIQVLNYTSTASIGKGAQIISSGGAVNVIANQKIGLQSIALAGGLSTGGTAVGGSFVVNVVNADDTSAYIDSGTGLGQVTSVDAAKGVSVTATSSIVPIEPDVTIAKIQLPLPKLSSVAVGGSAGGGDAAVSGSVIVDDFSISTLAYIASGAKVNQDAPYNADTAGQTLTVSATDTTTLVNVAGALAASEGSAGIGVGLIVDVINKNVNAYVGSSAQVYAGDNVQISATSTEDLDEIAVAGGVSEDAAVAGAIIVVALDQGGGSHSTSAYIDNNATLHSKGSVTISASDNAPLELISGNVAIGGSAGVGASAAILVRDGNVDAAVHNGANVDASGGTGLGVSATQTENLTLIAVGGAGGEDAGVAGSVVVDDMSDTTKAHVDKNVTIGGDTQSAAASVSATDNTTITAVAGEVAAGGTAGVGAGIDVEVITKDTEASIGEGSSVTVGGDALVDANSTESVNSIAVGAGFGGTAAVNVNVGVSDFNVTTKAFIGCSSTDSANMCGGGDTTGPSVIAGGTVRVSATENLTLNIIGGNLSAAGTAAVGAAAAVPVITKNTYAYIGVGAFVVGAAADSVSVATGGATVDGTDLHFDPNQPGVIGGDGSTLTLPFDVDTTYTENEPVIYDNGCGATSDCPGASISGLTNEYDNSAKLYYVHIVSGNQVQLKTSQTNTTADSGSIACGHDNVVCGLSAPSVEGEGHRLVPTDKAGVREDASPRIDPSTDVSGNQITLRYPTSFTTGDEVVYSSGGGDPIGGLTDGGTYYVIVVSSGNPGVVELAATKCDATGAADDCGGTAQAKNPIHLTSLGSGRSHSIVASGSQPTGDGTEQGPQSTSFTSAGFSGVAVTASNSDNIIAVGVSAGFAGAAAVNISGVVDVINVTTQAFIDENAKVNCNSDCSALATGSQTGQSVEVAATNVFHEIGVAATIAIGGDAGVGVGIGVHLVTLTTDAYVNSGATVRANNNIKVLANGLDTIVSVVAGAGGGTVGVAGTVGVTIWNVHTFADTGTGVTLAAGNNVLFSATDTTKPLLITASLAGGFVGVGVAVGVAEVTKQTEAFIGAFSNVAALAGGSGISCIYDGSTGSGCNSTIPGYDTATIGGVLVQATSTEKVFGLAASAGFGAVGVAGGVGVTLLHVTTEAYIDNSTKVNCNVGCTATISGSQSGQSVNVSAADDFNSLTVAGGVAGGFVGVAGGVDIGVADVSVQAYLGVGSNVRALGNAEVNALSEKNVQTYALSVGGGFVGGAAAVSVWSVGTEANSTYNEAAGGINRGTFDASNETSSNESDHYHKGDVVTDTKSGCGSCSAQTFAAKVDDPTTAPQFDSNGNGVDSSDWQASSDALAGSGGSSAQGSADQVASGNASGSAYNGVLGGSTDTSSSPAWNSGTSYGVGDKVSYNGSVWQAQVANTNVKPGTNKDWLDQSAGDATNSRISGFTSGATTSINNSAPGSHLASNALTAPSSGGTTATIGGTVVAGGAVRVQANENLTIFGLAGAAAGGFVGVGAGILVLNVDANTDAGILGSANVTAGSGTSGDCVNSGDCVLVQATFIESVDGLGIAASGGAVAINGDVVVISDSSTQNAHIDNGASVRQAGDGIDVLANGNRDVSALAAGGGVGAGAGGASVATLEMSGDETAQIGDVTVGSGGTVGAIDVAATATIKPSTSAISVEVGAVGLSGAVAWTDLSGTTKASSGAHGSAASLTVTATGDQSNVTAETFDLAAGAFALGLTIRHASDDRNTEADTTASATSGVALSLTGAANISAIATNHATAAEIVGIPEISIGGVSITVLFGIAEVGGATRVQLDGNISHSSSITATAHGDNAANSPVAMIGASVVGGAGAYSDAEITQGASIEALVGSDATLDSNGAIDIEARTMAADGTTVVANTATADVDSINIGLAASISIMVTNAVVDSDVKATLDGTVTGSSSITVKAIGTNTATATTRTASLSLAAGITGSGAGADIGKHADTEASAGTSSSLTSNGTIAFTATSHNSATATDDGGAGALGLAVAITLPSATVEGATNASIGGDVTGASSGIAVSATAKSTNNANASSILVAGGLVAAAGSEADSTITSDAGTIACGGVYSSGSCSGNGSWNVPGADVSFSATSNNVSTAYASGIGGGLANIQILFTDAENGGPTFAGFDASIGQGGDTAGDSLSVTASAENVATADTNVDGGGLASLQGATSTAKVTSDAGTTADLGSHAKINVTGGVLIQAGLGHNGVSNGNCANGSCGCNDGNGSCASAYAHGGGGGIISGGDFNATGYVEAPVTAEMAGKVTSAGSLTVQASSKNDAEAQTKSLGIGAVSFSLDISDAEVTSTAVTKAVVDQSGSATTTGSSGVGCGTAPSAGICIEATSANAANGAGDGLTVGLIALGAGLPTAIVDGGTKANYDGSIGSAGNVTVYASSANVATALVNSGGFGAITLTGDAASACVGGYGSSGCQAGDAYTSALVGGDANLGSFDGSAATIGSINVIAAGNNTATATASSEGGGLITLSVVLPTAADYGTTNAEIDGNVGTGPGSPGAGSISVSAGSSDKTISEVTSDSGGLAALSDSEANSDTESQTTAQFGNGNVAATGNITLSALSSTDADATASVASGGLLNLAGLSATATDNPLVQALVTGGNVAAGGTLTIAANHGAQPVHFSDGTIQAVNVGTDTIDFGAPTGVSTGATVTYQAPFDQGCNCNFNIIGGLNDGQTYGVIATGTDTIKLGDEFVTTSGAGNPGDLLGHVDFATNTIQFNHPTNFAGCDESNNGDFSGCDRVTYTSDGSAIPGLVSGNTYIVVPVDAYTIRLRDGSTPSRQLTFDPSTVINPCAPGSCPIQIVNGNDFYVGPGSGVSGSINEGDAVVYEPPTAQTFNGNNVDISLTSQMINSQTVFVPVRDSGTGALQYSNTNKIYMPNTTLVAGDNVVYTCEDNPVAFGGTPTGCTGIGGLTLGHTYVVVHVTDSGNAVQLASLAQPTVVLDVSHGGSGVQVLTKVGTGPIGGLTPGDTYYVHYTSSTDFELKDSQGNVVSGVNASGNSGPNTLTVIGIPLTGQGSGVQSLVVNLTSSGGGVMLGVGGPGAELGNAGDNVPSATATGVGGGAVNVQVAISTTNSTPTVNTTISSGATLEGNDVAIYAGSTANGAATAQNAGGGLISGQHSGAQVNITNNETAEVDGTVTAVFDLQVLASSVESPAVAAKVDGGGLFAFGDANADAPTTHHTVVSLNGTLTAGRTLLAEAREGFNGSLTAQANVAGLGTDANAAEDGSLAIGANSQATTEVNVTGTLNGQTVYLSGDVGAQHTLDSNGVIGTGDFTGVAGATQVNGVTATARASSESDALGASSRATGEIDVNDVAGVFLNGATITGGTVELHARHENQSFSTNADAACDCGGGYAGAHAPLNYTSQSNVTADSSTVIRTAGLLVDTFQNVSWSYSYNAHGGLFVDHDGDANLSDNGTREIHWSAVTYLLGDPNPVLTVDSTGTIVAKSSDVHVYDNGTGPELSIGDQIAPGDTIVVAPIEYTDLPTALFKANANIGIANTPDSTIDNDPSGTAIFFIQETWNSVKIVNNSDRAMVFLSDNSTHLSIDTLNQSFGESPQANINISVKVGAQNNPSTFQADVKQLFVPTDVLVESARGPPTTGFDMTFQGGISNIIGDTTLRNDRGDIIVASGAGPFTSNALHLIATDGSVGCATNDPSCASSSPLDAVLVQYATGPTGSPTIQDVVLDGTAFDDFHLTLTTVRRDSTVASSADITPVIGPLKAGRDISIKIDDSNEGIVPITVGDVDFVQFNPDTLPPSPEGACNVSGSNQCVPTVLHFRPDPSGAAPYVCTVPSRNCVADAFVEIAYATDTKAINADYTFTNPASPGSAGLVAGNDINVHHDSTATDVTFTVDQVVDGTFSFESKTYGSKNNTGRTDLHTNGFIVDTEVTGSLRVGQIQSTGVCSSATLCPGQITADVTLNSPEGVIDAESDAGVLGTDPTPTDVIARNITINSGTGGTSGGVGTPNDFLEIHVNADGGTLGVLTITDNTAPTAGWSTSSIPSNVAAAHGTYGVFVTETTGDLELNRVLTNGDANLTTDAGSIVDARNNGSGDNSTSSAANVVANNIDMAATGGSVGTRGANPDATGNDVKIDSSHLRTGRVGLEADDGIYVTETTGALNLILAKAFGTGSNAATSTSNCSGGCGDGIRLTVRDSGAQGEDFNLIDPSDTITPAQNGRSVLFAENAPTAVPHGLVDAPDAWIVIRAGDNVTLGSTSAPISTGGGADVAGWSAASSVNDSSGNTQIIGGLWIDIEGDYYATATDPDVGFGTVMNLHGTITPGTLTTTGGPNNDGCASEIDPGRDCNITRIFGNADTDTFNFDQTFLGGRTFTYGSNLPTLKSSTAPLGDSNDFFVVNELQSMNVDAGYSLNLDGQAGTDTYTINTTGSQPCLVGDPAGTSCHNYVINVLDTGAPDDGTDDLVVNGVNGPCDGYTDVAQTIQCPTDDIFLLRAANYIAAATDESTPNVLADDPGFVAELHGTLGQAIVPTSTQSVNLTICFHAGCAEGQTISGAVGTFSDPSFVVGARIQIAGGDSGIWAGSYTIGSIAADGSSITLEEILPVGVSLTTEEVPTNDVALTGVSVGVLENDVTTSDPTGNSAVRTQSVERINYDAAINGRLTVNGLGGNDYYAVDDETVTTTLDGGSGNDSFQIGQIYGLTRDDGEANPNPVNQDANTRDTSGGSLAEPDQFGTIATTRGWLSAGASAPLIAVGGSGDDIFTVYSNQAPLRLEGDDGNDLFVVRAFALAQTTIGGDPNGTACTPTVSNAATCQIVWINAQAMIAMPALTSGFSTAAESDIRTGTGNNQVEYNMNAPVSIDGGSGFNKVVILGTEFADHIVITSTAIYGAGLSVTYTNIQVLEVDALEGDDTIDVLSTAPGVETRVIGGLGSDTVNVGGDVVGDVFAKDINGTSGTVNHLVTSQDPNYNGLVADGVPLSVAQADQG
ncbi:MAG TPA: carbohydrate-binding protein, partial [Gaiellaceae bacterium]